MNADTLSRETDRTRARYDRIAPFYDLMEMPMERLLFSALRKRAWERVVGPRVLEIGIGTGKNIPYYPPGLDVVGIDLSEKMLERARRRAAKLGFKGELRCMDIQDLAFDSGSFDGVISTFVFCSVPEPIKGLKEALRVLKPGGRAVFLEHVKPGNPLLARVFELLNPFVVRVMGANINRHTVENVEMAGFHLEAVEDLYSDVVKLIVAKA